MLGAGLKARVDLGEVFAAHRLFTGWGMMASMNKSAVLLALHAAVALVAWAREAHADGDPQLLGCWRAERVEQTLADGRVWADVGGCTLRFEAQHITSACVLREGNQPVRYTYKITAAGTYSARIVEHPARPQAVGSERDYLYRIQDDRLFIITYPQTATPAPLSQAVKVESVSIKVGSATDMQSRSDQALAGCDGRLVSAPAAAQTTDATRFAQAARWQAGPTAQNNSP
jgi:hypothetical protein